MAKLSAIGVPMNGTGVLWPNNLHEYVELGRLGFDAEMVNYNTWCCRTQWQPDLRASKSIDV